MPLSDDVRNLLLKYIAGETTVSESEQVESWLADDPNVFNEFEQLWDLWYVVGTATNVFRFNVDKGWEGLAQKRLKQKEIKADGKRLKKSLIWGGCIAATILIILGWLFVPKNELIRAGTTHTDQVGTMYHGQLKPFKDSVSRKDVIVKTAPGERRKVKLPDGSLIWLNGSSVARYSFNKENNTRTLALRGQAFFDIHHDASRPFIVKTKHASINVLGTRFDVAAYPDDDVTEAVLTGGSIQFITEANRKKIIKHIDPGQKISLNTLSGELKVTEVDTAFYASWKEGKIIFRNETFLEVARAMEHKYDVAIVFKNKSLMGKRLNGYLQKESLEEALQALKLTLQFQYSIDNNKVIISR